MKTFSSSASAWVVVTATLCIVGCASQPSVDSDPRSQASHLTSVTPTNNQSYQCDVLVVGGSTSAYSATLAAAREGAITCLVQPYAVVGGQFTTQGLSASDDPEDYALKNVIPGYPGAGSVALESFAYSASQAQFRASERSAASPSGCWVSDLCTLPQTAQSALEQPLEPYINRNLIIIDDAVPTGVLIEDEGNGRRRVRGATFAVSTPAGRVSIKVNAYVVIEGTDLGDIVELAQIPSRIGQESQGETSETILAGVAACPLCQQSFTYDILVQHGGSRVTGDAIVPAPSGYGVSPWLSSFTQTYHHPTGPRAFFSEGSIFDYRRAQRGAPNGIGDISILNWACDPDQVLCGNDYGDGVLVGVSADERMIQLKQAHDRAQAWLHYLQTSTSAQLAPFRTALTDAYGIALAPYIREARRGVAMTTIRHDDIAKSFQPRRARARAFTDSGGIGFYNAMDIHPTKLGGGVPLHGDDQIPLPFQIPLGALVPANTDGLLLAAKSIGTTHLTNAAYRTHVVEWSIGEAAGAMAALSAREQNALSMYTGETSHARAVQELLTSHGVPLYWFSDVPVSDPDFQAIQMLAVAGVMDGPDATDLRFMPAAAVTRSDAADTVVKALGLPPIFPATPTFADCPNREKCWAYGSIEALASRGIVHGIGNGLYGVEQPLTRAQLGWILDAACPSSSTKAWPTALRDSQVAQHRELARAMHIVWKTIGLK